MEAAVNRSPWILALMFVLACGSSDPTGSSPGYSMSGSWGVNMNVSITLLSSGSIVASCAGSTTASIADRAGSISGSHAGTLPCIQGGELDVSDSLSGNRSAAELHFVEDTGTWLCTYAGTMASDKAASGTINCSGIIQENGVVPVSSVSGSWSASRLN